MKTESSSLKWSIKLKKFQLELIKKKEEMINIRNERWE